MKFIARLVEDMSVFFMEGMSEPEQMEYCCDCGQRIAKDWSE